MNGRSRSRVAGRERHELHADAGVAERRHLEQRPGRRLEMGSQRRDGRVLFPEPRLQGVDGRGHRKPAAELDGVKELHHSSPRYASRISGLARRFAAVSASTTSPVWIT